MKDDQFDTWNEKTGRRRREVQCRRLPIGTGVILEFFELQQDGSVRVPGEALKFDVILDPSLATYDAAAGVGLSEEMAQRLFDDLWHLGLRPSKDTDWSAARIERAHLTHLDDLRSEISFLRAMLVACQPDSEEGGGKK